MISMRNEDVALLYSMPSLVQDALSGEGTTEDVYQNVMRNILADYLINNEKSDCPSYNLPYGKMQTKKENEKLIKAAGSLVLEIMAEYVEQCK